MTTSTVTPEIVAFAQGVRAALADLPAEEVDDLTEGLEADLAEAYAEDLQRELPDPAAYATELRAAAGLPMRTKAKTGAFSGLTQGWRDTRADIAIAIRRNPALASAIEFLVSLRPVWWVARAWLATWLVAAFFGNERGFGMAGTWWFVLIAFVVISVQWGRGRWHGNGVPALIAIGNVVAVVAVLPVMAAADDGSDGGDFDRGFQSGVNATVNDPPQDGLVLRGVPVTNIYAYDASGKLLRNVQLFNQRGKPLEPFSSRSDDDACADDECSTLVQPGRLETGQPVFNVFPLGTVAAQWDDEAQRTVPKPGASVIIPKAPFLKVPGLFAPEKVSKSND
jgi:hypothetical protein